MSVIENTIVIQCKPEEAFEALQGLVHDPGAEITELEPPRHLVETMHDAIDTTISYNVHSAYDGTRLTSVLATHPHGLQRLMAPMRVRKMRQHEEQKLAALRMSLEQPPPM
ncbi:MAG: hypothetical protein ACXVDH_02300 [Nocardioides sp.]|uniref:hypothetical protein n=1 Tax=Nocardioides nematodiphilus TaxID=2849669 RepID=UPI001CD99098|nr:hypothetical protein [Nocardioides nematodiphilus]MCA1983588.1 hypothetical protein [Nocardioides nematodiphilus]